MLPAINGHQRETHGRAGRPVAALNRVPLSAAHDKAQIGSHVRPVGVVMPVISLGCSTRSSLVRTGGGFTRSRLFSRSGLDSRAHQFATGHHVLQDITDVPECHVVRRLSYSVASFKKQPREALIQNVGIPFQRA
jgi:hypothetical protein